MTGTVNITTKSLADNYIYVPENCLVFYILLNQHIKMISERSCDTEVMMLKIQLCITGINDI